MFKQTMIVIAVSGAMSLVSGTSLAAGPVRAQARQQAQEEIYGSQLMTEQERIEHRTTMRTLKTQQERDAYRLEHHKLMQERAAARGIMLPDMPPRAGAGAGAGQGGGMGQRGGMGQGGGMGPGGRNR